MPESVHRFTATCVSAYQEHGALVVGIASDDSPDPQCGLILQRDTRGSGVEFPASLSRPHAELVGFEPGGYIEIDQCSLMRDRITIQFSKAAQRHRGIGQLEIQLRLDDLTRKRLQVLLAEIFRDGDWFEVAIEPSVFPS